MNPMHQGGVVILDFGSQYTQLIARRIREQHVFSEILSSNTSADSMMKRKPKAVMLSGGPNSVFEDSAPQYDPKIFDLDIPILGICYGLQLLVHNFGGKISSKIEYVSLLNTTDINEMPGDVHVMERFVLTTFSVGIFRLAAKLRP